MIEEIIMSFYVIIRGPLGCGKSTLSKRLSKILNAKYVSVDKILEKYNLEDDWESGYISQRSFIKANEIISKKAERILKSGRTVIFDGNFYWKSQIKDLIKRLNFPYYVFTLKVPLEICIKRDKNRSQTLGEDAVITVYKKSTQFKYGTVINVNKPLEECIKKILSILPRPKHKQKYF